MRSAGILLHRRAADGGVEVLIAHMGGPFWARKDAGAWSIPKGEFDPASESPASAARREFREELGLEPPDGPYVELGTFAYSSGKRVTVFAADGAGFSVEGAVFGEFELEWPPRSGAKRLFPEVDRVAWVATDAARTLHVTGQRPAVDRLEEHLAAGR